MNERASQVGVSQRLRVEWLEATANLMLAGNDVAATRDALDDMLANKLSIGKQQRARESAEDGHHLDEDLAQRAAER